MNYKLKKISGDASFREFYRVKKNNKTSIIVFARKEQYKNLILFMPNLKEIYPEHTNNLYDLPPISNDLCGKFRPGHFNGVITIIDKLFEKLISTYPYLIDELPSELVDESMLLLAINGMMLDGFLQDFYWDEIFSALKILLKNDPFFIKRIINNI